MSLYIISKFQAVGAICRQAGHRFGDHVEKVVPLVLQYAKMEDEELREQCLQVHISLNYNIIQLCAQYLLVPIDNISKLSDIEFSGL